MKKTTLIFLSVMLSGLSALHAQWGVPPAGWNKFAIGLTDEGSATNPAPPSRYNNIRIARQPGANYTGLTHRVRYINEGVDRTGNWYSWLPNGGVVDNYIADSELLGMQPAFNIYMLQEEGDAAVAVANLADANFMRDYFWNIIQVAQKANGHKAVFVIEPDTWGYIIKANYGQNPTSPGNAALRPNLIPSHAGDLSGTYPHLAGLPNTLSGVGRGIIRTIRTYAPDAYIGFHVNHWAVWSNGATGPAFIGANANPTVQGVATIFFASTSDLDVNVNFQVAWYNELFGGASTCDKGDFLAVEKYGLEEGMRWNTQGNPSLLYYGNAEYAKFLYWSKKIGQGLNMPLLGWQVPLGTSALPNGLVGDVACAGYWDYRYKDGFLEYFFSHRQDFICAGFIGLFMGPGTGMSVTYYNTGSTCGDRGYLFNRVRTDLDPIQPINMNLPSIGTCAATSSPTCSLPVEWLTFSGVRKQGKDYLQWSTASEKNNNYFEIEQSTDGIHYHSSGQVGAAVNGNVANRYHWENLGAGVTYYRIKQVDIDGKFDYSKSIVLADQGTSLSLELALYPNPANDEVYVQLTSSADENYSVELFDINGRLLISEKSTASDVYLVNKLSVKDLPSGVYYVRATRMSDGENIREMLVKK